MNGEPARPAVRTLRDATEEYDWSVFLHGYANNEPEYKQEFIERHNLNRRERRRLESKTRKLRNRRR
jgi:hypothetical protein